ncbi:MAG: DNA adenine methylase [Desulfuromonadaceae bacterium]|nr:DNA adenine methylase [Desulfuromonadaceae bacterium]
MKHYPVIAWPGGKRRLAKVLLPLINSRPHTCYVEEFAGGASMFFLREPAAVEVLNDCNGELVNLYRVIKNHLDEFAKQFRYAVASRQLFEWSKETPPHVLTDIQRAARFLYLQKLAFGSKVSSQTFGTSPSSPPRFNILRLEEDLSQAHLRLSRAWIEHLGWADCVRKWDRDYTLHFLDPPYYETEGYGVPFELEQYGLIAETMKTMKGSAILTINDHPEMRRIFKGFKMQTMKINYTIGGGGKGKDRQELIYRNW